MHCSRLGDKLRKPNKVINSTRRKERKREVVSKGWGGNKGNGTRSNGQWKEKEEEEEEGNSIGLCCEYANYWCFHNSIVAVLQCRMCLLSRNFAHDSFKPQEENPSKKKKNKKTNEEKKPCNLYSCFSPLSRRLPHRLPRSCGRNRMVKMAFPAHQAVPWIHYKYPVSVIIHLSGKIIHGLRRVRIYWCRPGHAIIHMAVHQIHRIAAMLAFWGEFIFYLNNFNT